MGYELKTDGSQGELQRAFNLEVDRLAGAASRLNLVEGAMRVRALGEIASCLGTAELLDLAIRIEAERRSGDKPA